jgi:cell division control protein 6
MAADGEGKDVVAPEHARQAKAEVYPEVKKEVLRELQLHEKLALLAIARRLRITKRAYAMTGDIEKSYQVVCEEYGEEARQHTQLWEYLKRMDGLGLIDLQPSGVKHRGQSFRISVQEAPVGWLEKEMEELLEGRKL